MINMVMQGKVIAITPWSKPKKGEEQPIRFAVFEYKKGTNPHPYAVGMQTKPDKGAPYFMGTAHYFREEEAMNTMLRLISRHNEGHTEKWMSYIQPTVKRV
jgi:hypothetical protein